MEGRAVIVDTDPGIDDAMALWLILSQPNINVPSLSHMHTYSF